MDLLILYLVFAIATSATLCSTAYLPTLKEAITLGIKNEFTESLYISTFVFFILGMLVAPASILAVLIPTMHDRFVIGLTNVIHTQKSVLE